MGRFTSPASSTDRQPSLRRATNCAPPTTGSLLYAATAAQCGQRAVLLTLLPGCAPHRQNRLILPPCQNRQQCHLCNYRQPALEILEPELSRMLSVAKNETTGLSCWRQLCLTARTVPSSGLLECHRSRRSSSWCPGITQSGSVHATTLSVSLSARNLAEKYWNTGF